MQGQQSCILIVITLLLSGFKDSTGAFQMCDLNNSPNKNCWCFITNESRSSGDGFQEQLSNRFMLRSTKVCRGER
jgi:hypothetical protein